MIGALIGAGMSAIGSVAGGVAGSKARRRAKQYIEDSARRERNWYDRRINEDESQRADAQRLLSMTYDNIKARNSSAAGAQAVVGGTDESVAADKAANSRALADAAAQIAASGAERKGQIEEKHLQNERDTDAKLAGVENSRAEGVATATGGLLQAAGGIANALDGAEIDKKTKQFENGNAAKAVTGRA